MAKKKKKTALAAALEKMAKKSAENKKANKQKKQAVQKKPEKENKVEAAKKAVKKSGVVISEKSAQKKREEKKKTNRVEATKKAIEKGQQRSALGTKVEKKTGTVKVQGENSKTEKVKYEYTPMTMQEYGQLEVGARTGQLQKTLKSNKDLNKKVTDLNVKDYAESPGVMGALDQMTQGVSVSEDPTYKYSESQKKIIDSQKKTGKYNVGRAVGAVAEFGLGGTGTVGSSIAKTGGKAVLKEAAEQGGKKLAKQTAKNIAKETAGDTVASLGLNTLDAVKFSYEDGKLNKEKFAKELALNVGGDILMGGAVSGITHGLSAKQVANFNRINKSIQKGEKVSDAEMKFYNKHVKELGNKIEQATKQTDTVDKAETQTETQNIPRNSNQEVKTQEPTISKTETVEPTVAKSATTEKTGDPTSLTDKKIESLEEEKKLLNRERELILKSDQYSNDMDEKSLHRVREIEDRIKDIDEQVSSVREKIKSPIAKLKTEIEDIEVEINYLKKEPGNEVEIEQLEKLKAIAINNLEIEQKAMSSSNGLNFNEYALNEIELDKLRKEYTELQYKAKNTENPEHYRSYQQRRMEIADVLDEYYSKKGMTNVATPSKKTTEMADDLSTAAGGGFSEEVKVIEKTNKRVLDGLYRTMVDTFHGFEQLARQLPKDSREVFRGQINALRNSRNKAGGWISEARVSAEGKVIGKSFNDIMGDMLKPKNAKKYDDFQYYLANKHNIDRYEQGKGVFGDSITAADSKAICEHLESEYPDFINIQQEVTDYFKDLQQYRVDTGLISKETADYLDALYPNYVPTFRIKDGKRVNIVENTSRTLGVGAPIKTATGGISEIIPLHQQVLNLTNYTLSLGEQNRLFNLIATIQGFDAKAIDPDIKIEDAVEACTFFTKETDGATNKYYTSFYDNGELKKIQITKQMYEGMREWNNDPDSLADMFNWKAKPLRGANSLFKNLITGWNPIFGMKNIVRDTGEALIYSKNVRGFIKSYPKAISAIVNPNSKYAQYFDLYQAAGGKYAHIRDDIKTFNIDSTFKKIAKSPIEVCQRFNDCLEAIPRMSEFISTIDNSLDMKGTVKANRKNAKELLASEKTRIKSIDDILNSMDAKTINRAMLNANEVTLNFGRSGIAGKALNSTVLPYFNPAIQGLDKLVRTFRDAKADGVKGMFSLFGKLGTFAIAPAMFNEIMMGIFGGEDYQILNTRDKNNNCFIPMGDGKFIKIPKARVTAAVAAPFEHFFRHVQYGDPMEWNQMFSTAWSNVGVMNPLENNLFSPFVAVFTNKTWYGGNIESASDLELREVGDRSKIFDETTSAISIWIGDKLNMSPKKIDYIIDGYTGVIGDFLLPATAQASNGNPLYKNFILDSVFSNKLATEFWEKNTTLEAYSEARGGEHTSKFNDWKAEYMYDALTINQAIHDIDNNKNLTKEQKLQKKRELKKGLNQYYKAAVDGTGIDLEPIKFISSQIGAQKALENYLPDSDNKAYSFKEHFKEFKETEDFKNLSIKERAKLSSEWLRTYSAAVTAQKKIDVTYHNSPDWTTIAVANAQYKGRDSIAESCGVFDSTIDDAKTYVKYKGNLNTWAVTQKAINKAFEKIEKNGTNTSDGLFKRFKNGVTAMALSNSTSTFKDRAYFITGSDFYMNAARGLKQNYNWTINELIDLGYSADSDGNTYFKKQEIINAIENSKASSREEKSMLFTLLAGENLNNPYGGIGDYSIKSDTGITKESSTNRSYSSRKSRKKKTSSGKKNGIPSWEEWVKDYITEYTPSEQPKVEAYVNPVSWEEYVQDFISKERSGGGTVKASKGNTGTSYQKKISSIIDKMEV